MTLICYQRVAKLLFFVFGISFLCQFLLACDSSLSPDTEPVAHSFTLTGSTMGTSYNVTVVEAEGQKTDQKKLQQIIDTRLETLNQQMSTYIDDSELSYLNRSLVGESISVSDELFEVLMLSIELSWLSNGAFDVSVGPLVDLWGFGGDSEKQSADSAFIATADNLNNAIPKQSAIDNVLRTIGYQNIQFDIANNSIVKLKPVSIDLSGIAKGYGVDKISEILLAAGYKNFMVEIGGELRLEGISPKSKPWKIAIEKPDGSLGEVHTIINISGAGMATSGDYRNYFEEQGIRYSHTIDPVTGRPITHNLASVTVVAPTSAYADGLATAINVMGPDRGLKLAQQQNFAVYLIIKTENGFEAKFTDAFRPYID